MCRGVAVFFRYDVGQQSWLGDLPDTFVSIVALTMVGFWMPVLAGLAGGVLLNSGVLKMAVHRGTR